jgi:hypothetical protein
MPATTNTRMRRRQCNVLILDTIAEHHEDLTEIVLALVAVGKSTRNAAADRGVFRTINVSAGETLARAEV